MFLDKVIKEMNAVTDNPLIFADDDQVISCGNFHGQPMALAFDFLGIAMAEIANSSERRIERLVNPSLSELPAFSDKVWRCQFRIYDHAIYGSSALVSENKILAHPASVDSIPSSGNQEDHVSMGTIAARKAYEIVKNARHVIAIEWLCAAQGVDFGHPERLGKGTKIAYDILRSNVTYLDNDRVMYPDIEKAVSLIIDGEVIRKVEDACGILD
jgi:histidine ammonia-lyase